MGQKIWTVINNIRYFINIFLLYKKEQNMGIKYEVGFAFEIYAFNNILSDGIISASKSNNYVKYY